MSDIMIPQPGAVFGDLTIVHNINFNRQSNPMQTMAMQQQNMIHLVRMNVNLFHMLYIGLDIISMKKLENYIQ